MTPSLTIINLKTTILLTPMALDLIAFQSLKHHIYKVTSINNQTQINS